MWRALRAGARAMLVGAWVFCASALRAQSPEIPPAISGEGPLQNDAFVPTSQDAVRALAAGDRAFEKALAAGAAGANAFDDALDAWHGALAAGVDADVTIDADALRASSDLFPDPDRTLARRSESAQCAVLRRIATLDPRLSALWRARFEALAAAALASAGTDGARLARVAHEHPLTSSAARAMLIAFDLAFEAADFVAAQSWLERARRELEIVRHGATEGTADIEAALARRRAALDAIFARHAAAGRPPPAWESAQRVHLESHVALAARRYEPARGRVRRPRAGIAVLDDGVAAIQSGETLFCVSPTGDVRSVDLTSAAGALALTFAPSFADARAELTLTPATDGTRIVVVAGRALGSRGNALVCLERGAAGEWRAVWGFGDQAYHVRDGENRALDDVLEAGLWEFEPGPAIDAGRVYVQARQWVGEGTRAAATDDGHIRAWCLSIDLATGVIRWKRWLAAGASLAAARSQRSFEARAAPAPPEPVATCSGRVFVSTGLGLGALLGTGDGALLWSVKCQRRSPEVSLRFASDAPVCVAACADRPAGADRPTDRTPATAVWLWTPADSDCAYRLRDGADLDARGVFDRPPLRLAAGSEILCGDACRIVGFTPGARVRAVWIADLDGGAHAEAAAFDREETAPATALLAPTRVFVASDRALYAYDRTRELYLLDRVPLPDADRFERPALAARDERMYVATRSSLWILRAE
jgi:hypothetical protein